MLLASAFLSLWSAFATPPESARPWCYWWWINGQVDRETITADLESMKGLGFGGVLMFDSRGYWDDAEHVENPAAEIGWGTDEWYDLVEFSIRECARLGLEFTMNASASGGTLNGFVDGEEYETDVMNRDEVVAHLDRAIGPLLKRVPELVGTTFTHIYSVSYEGSVKTGGSWNAIKNTFYATMREWAHAHGLKVYSESGGPWGFGATSAKLDCDQIDLLVHNDFPQGEFWPIKENGTSVESGHANANGRFFQRAAALSARCENRSIVSMESFTHMHRHYSVDPAFLKPLADMSFADGANRLVWHTFTCSPKKFGVPGAEYFAGSHINRNVTWQDDAAAFINYLWRCQAMLQRGEYVDDGEFVNVSTNYHGWGRYRKDDNAQFTTTHRREGDADWFFVVGEGKGKVALNASCEGRAVEIWDPVTTTRKVVAGEAMPDGKTLVELNLPVGGSAFVVFAPREGNGEWGTGNGRPVLKKPPQQIPVTNAWRVSFAYHRGISAAPPAPVTMETLRDWTSFGEDGKVASTELRYFSGTATYSTTIVGNGEWGMGNGECILSLGEVPTGLAHVFVNGIDCGIVWCAPWEADISSALREGENEIKIRYTNNWYNRLVGDCFLSPMERVTTSTLHYWTVPREKSDPSRPWRLLPTVYSGPAISDVLQPSGLLGPVSIVGGNACTLTPKSKKEALPPRVENPAGLGSEKFANWYVLGDSVVFTNSLPAGTVVEGVVFDSSGKEIYRATAKGRVWSWKPSKQGFYTVGFEKTETDGSRTPIVIFHRPRMLNESKNPAVVETLGECRRERFAVAVSRFPARSPLESPPKFGFNANPRSDSKSRIEQFAAIRLLGMSSFVRYHYFSWDKIEAEGCGIRDWAKVDEAFADASAAGYGLDRILVNIFGTPEWLSTAPEKVAPGWINAKKFYPPKDMLPVREFTKAFCLRYPGIRNFEIWNEPHLDGFSIFWKKGTPRQFVDLLRAGYEGVKEADPSINVVMGGIGMRYLPFYEEFVRLGGVEWYDMMDTHCGYDMRPFRETEARYGVKSKPYWEGEWHTVLYNCSNPNPPSEEECAFRMLVNFADLIHTVPGYVTGFGLMCGDHTPETAKWYAKAGGIQQVSGLFRSVPMLEPRFSAYALRCATDLFSGEIKSLGAWRYGDDGSYRAALFTSDSGKVAFVWNNNERTKCGVMPPELAAVAARCQMLDWEGHVVPATSFCPRRMFYLVDPDVTGLAKGDPMEVLDYSSYAKADYGKGKHVHGVYGELGKARRMPLGASGASFAADLSSDEFTLDVLIPEKDKPQSLVFAIDAAGKGYLQDVLEFIAVPDNPLTKTRTPELNGDIPSDYSLANVPLSKSSARLEREANGWRWQVNVWRGDLYPFACAENVTIPFSIVVNTSDKTLKWGEGLGKICEASLFGRLFPTGFGKVLGETKNMVNVFMDAKLQNDGITLSVEATSGERGAGSIFQAAVQPGSQLAFAMKARGKGPISVEGWAFKSGEDKLTRQRCDGGKFQIESEWKDISGYIVLPSRADTVDFQIFSWKRPNASWEVKDLKLINE